MSAGTDHAGSFASRAQRIEAGRIGMWLYLATEAMMFAALFAGLAVIRMRFPQGAEAGSAHLLAWLGGINTAVLLTSSLCMALAVLACREGRRSGAVGWLMATGALGTAFLAVKLLEYRTEFQEGLIPGAGPAFPLGTEGAELFFNLYFAATGLHFLHLLVGVGLAVGLAWRLWRGSLAVPGRAVVAEMVGMYWHLVDIVWLFLFPVLYLI